MTPVLTLKQLRYFVAIAEAGALSRAARSLNIAQSALSHHVAEIERMLGVVLLERRARGIELAPAGRRLLQHASAILSAQVQAEADVRTFTEAASGPVTVGLSHTAINLVSLDVMKRVRQTCPAVHMMVVEGLSPTLIDWVLSGKVDVAVAYNPPADSRLNATPLLEEDLYLIGQSKLIGATSKPIAFKDIPQSSVLGLSPVPASRSIIQPQILRNQITPNPHLEIDSLFALKKALEAGLGCAILARSTVLEEVKAKSVHARRIVEPRLNRTLAIVSLSDRPSTRAFVEVRAVVTDVIRQAEADGRWPGQPARNRKSKISRNQNDAFR